MDLAGHPRCVAPGEQGGDEPQARGGIGVRSKRGGCGARSDAPACQQAPSSQASNGPEITRQIKSSLMTPDLHLFIRGHAKARSVPSALRLETMHHRAAEYSAETGQTCGSRSSRS